MLVETQAQVAPPLKATGTYGRLTMAVSGAAGDHDRHVSSVCAARARWNRKHATMNRCATMSLCSHQLVTTAVSAVAALFGATFPVHASEVNALDARDRRHVLRRAVAVALAAVALGTAAGAAEASVYWGTYAGNLGRANLDGTGVTANLLAPRQVQNVCGVAVDRNWIYFAVKPANRIGRATLDGTLVFDNFITGLTNPCGVAVDAQHIYWADTLLTEREGSDAPTSMAADATTTSSPA